MKKMLALLVACTLVSGLAAPVIHADEKKSAPVADYAPGAKSAVLIDSDTGTVLYDKAKDTKLPPASITKIMTMLLIMEALDQGKLTMTDKVRASENAASMGGSQIFLEPGEEMTVEEMLKGIAMASGNDASVAMAEKLAGSEEAFVAQMNARAGELGMNNTHFSNCNGLPVANHYTTAYDIAIMSRELLKHPEITKFTGAYQDYLRKSSAKPFWLVNTNKLVRFYPGADGLKTGFTAEARFCLSATAKKDGLRVIAVVMGEPDTKTRNAEVTKLFDYAFAQYASHPILKAGDVIGSIRVDKGKEQVVTLKAKTPYSILLKKGEDKGDVRYELKLAGKVKAPLKAGDKIGTLAIYRNNKLLNEVPVESPANVDKAGWWTLFKRTFQQLVTI
ncbi:D-alanyl-D-alanine carboxypeptidase family protein [Gorillibacterium sp. sgz500922]|uniref:D-alanyl-D-alanine carboxypeptidase family protein n=1 Tax=Gorillibacterium sp. sgz500922 TaxID=3446694 RepID=UPI003F678052